MLALTLAVLAVANDENADWPRFRGADGSGASSELTYPAKWSTDNNVAWSTELTAAGWASPVVADGRVFLAGATMPEGGKPMGFTDGVREPESRGSGGKAPSKEVGFGVRCLDLDTGIEVWSTTLQEQVPPQPTHPSNTYATETPAIWEDRLFVYFGSIGLVACLNFDGSELWRRDLGAYRMNADFGTGSSVIAADGLVFVQNDNDEGSFLVALDADSGEEAWRVTRPRGSGWSTPVLWHDQLIACGPGSVTGYDPGGGEELWTITGISGSFSASPAISDESIFVGNSGPGSRGPLLALTDDADGESVLGAEVPDNVRWFLKSAGPGMCSPVAHDGLLYVVASGGVIACFDAENGERVYRERLPDAASVVSSLWAAGNMLFVLDETGNTYVILAGRQFVLVRQNKIDDLFWSTPSEAGNSLLLRGTDRLYCVRTKPGSSSRGSDDG